MDHANFQVPPRQSGLLVKELSFFPFKLYHGGLSKSPQETPMQESLEDIELDLDFNKPTVKKRTDQRGSARIVTASQDLHQVRLVRPQPLEGHRR